MPLNRKDKLLKVYEKYRLIIGMMLIIILIMVPQVIKNGYFMGIVCRILLYTTLVGSLNIINGYSGQFNFGHAGFFCVGSYIGAILATTYGWGFWPAMINAGIGAALVGLLISFPTLKLKGIYLAIVTIGFSEIIRIIALNWVSVTGGPMGIKGIPSPKLFGKQISGPGNYYYLFIAIAVSFIFITNRILKSRIGRAWLSIREDELAAKSLGVESSRYKSINFMYGAFWAGIVGAAFGPYYKYISSDMFSLDEGYNILTMMIIGGQGTLIGPFVGVIIATTISEFFRFASEYRIVVYGVLIIVMMWCKPQGIAGDSESIFATNRIFKRKKKIRFQEAGDNLWQK